MRIVENWQYKYIEKCLFNYANITDTKLATEANMVKAINGALKFFKGTSHETMMKEFYFKADYYRKKLSNSEHYQMVCEEMLHTELSNGWVMRREIVYRVAMNCYALNIWELN